MCSYLEWLLHVEAPELEAFTQRVKKEYEANCGPVSPQWVSIPASVAPVIAAPLVAPIESTSVCQAAASPTHSYPFPDLSFPLNPPRSNQSSPETSDEECLTPPSGDDQAAIAHSSSHSNMMNTDTTIKSKLISSIPNPINSADPSFAFAARARLAGRPPLHNTSHQGRAGVCNWAFQRVLRDT